MLSSFIRGSKGCYQVLSEEKSEKASTADYSRIKKIWLDKIDHVIPACFIDNIHEQFITDPVVTPYGGCYNRSTLEQWWAKQRSQQFLPTTDPNTTLPLNKEMLIHLGKEKSDILQLFAIVGKKRNQLQQMVLQMNDSVEDAKRILPAIETFQRFANEMGQQLAVLLDKIFQQNKSTNVNDLNKLKERTKIDINSLQHLKFWEKYSGKLNSTLLFDTKGNGHKIPKTVAAIMTTAAMQHNTTDGVPNIVKEVQEQRDSFWGKLCCCFQSPPESELLNANLTTVDLLKYK